MSVADGKPEGSRAVASARMPLGKKTFVGLVIVAIGSAFAWRLVGLRIINPLDASWVSGDIAQLHLAWLFLRHEASLGFPLGWLHELGYPFGVPFAYSDVLPWAGLGFWTVRNYLPADFQYVGLVFTINAILQFYFGYRLCRRICPADTVVALLGGLLFMAAVPFTARISFGHVALTSQWLILAAIEFFLVCGPAVTLPIVLASCALCFVAGATNAYLALMVLIVVYAGYWRIVLVGFAPPMMRLVHVTAGFMSSVLAAGLALLMFGFLRLDDAGSYPGAGYQIYSMNLLALFDPPATSLWVSGLPRGEGQYEGFNYLGLGMMLLAGTSVAARPSIVGNLFRLSIAPAWLVVVACLLLALSTKATVGNHVLYDLRLPNRMIELLSIFRASGRLFWPAFYLIMLAVFAACVLAFGRRAVLVLVPVIVVQFFDLRHFHDSIQAQRKNRDATTFTDAPAWQSVAESHRNLVVQPPWQCGAHETPAGVPSFWIFGRLAERHGMTINSVYTSRSSPKQNAFFCGIQPERILDRGLASDSAYVFRNLAAPFGVDLGDHFCREQDGVVLCSLSGDRRGLDASLVRAAPVTPIGRRFAALSTDGHPLFGLGWTYSDGVGRWSTARKASLLVRVADRTKPARIVLSATSVIPATGPYQIRVTANGSAVADWTLSFGKGTEAEVTVPPELMDSEGLIGLKLHMPDALTARQIRIYREEWPIGIRVDQVLVVQ